MATVVARAKKLARRQVRILGSRWDGRDSFSITEAAEILGISRGSAYAAARNGSLPFVEIGGRKIVSRYVIESLLTAA
jgi:excisionase family DNA binding protein